MPSVERSKFWFCRVDGPEQHLRDKCSELSGKIDTIAMLAAYHLGSTKENPHCHFVIQLSSEPQKQSFAVRIKQLFGIEKRSQYALAVWDGNRGAGACSYLFHEEGAPIIVNKGFSDSDIDAARQANETVQRVLAVNKERASHKFVDKAINHFAEPPSTEELVEYMVELCRNGELYWPGTFRAKQLIEEVRIRTTECPRAYARLLYEKMFL